ncbi:Glutamate--tRNA ligase [Ruminococcaceae bacterium BL-6]|nr:Glutamate--tRNA ligase [Ruminococcaceae bacterium BL-6]
MQKKTVRTRFAPSPTGYMHVGNLRTALYEYLIAKSMGGEFILRIEDTDQERQVEGAVEIIYDTLKTVGLQHDEGPDIGGKYGPYVQSERKEIYKKYAEQLVREGKAYYCFCSKERLASLHSDNGDFSGYDRHCRNLPPEEIDAQLKKGTPYVIRQKMPIEGTTTFRDAVYGDISVENKELEDQVLLKSDGFPTYNFANVVDDHLMEITHVVRGCEYLSSTPKYNLLYEAFGWEVPVYVHLPLIKGKNPDGTSSKLSKRHGSTGFADLVREGYLPQAIVNYIALLGWCPKDNVEIMDMQGLVSRFSIDGISKAPAIFDYDKLTWMNGEYLRAMTPGQFTETAMPYYRRVFGDVQADWKVLTSILQPRVTKLTQIPEMIGFFKELPDYPADYFVNKKSKTNLENSKEMLRAAIDTLRALADWSVESLHETLLQLAQKLEVKNGTLLWPVRIAAAGQTVTPGGAMEILAILGKGESLKRLETGLEKLNS